jgi:hypothetical protein
MSRYVLNRKRTTRYKNTVRLRCITYLPKDIVKFVLLRYIDNKYDKVNDAYTSGGGLMQLIANSYCDRKLMGNPQNRNYRLSKKEYMKYTKRRKR